MLEYILHGREQCTAAAGKNNAMMLGSTTFTRPHDSLVRQICCANADSRARRIFRELRVNRFPTPWDIRLRRTIFSKPPAQRGGIPGLVEDTPNLYRGA
jgi:hypothetical protein